MGDNYFDRAYADNSPEETRALYDAWAETYDTELQNGGYATPGRVAKALFQHLPEPDAPVLDFGCGTGLSGLALRLAGYNVIDGTDPSPNMLEGAAAKGVYRQLSTLDTTNKTPVKPGAYRAITLIGVVGIGAAPPDTVHTLMKSLPKGGLLALSLNDQALAEPQFEGALCQWLDCGAARLLFKEHGPHLPDRNLKSNVYILEKT